MLIRYKIYAITFTVLLSFFLSSYDAFTSPKNGIFGSTEYMSTELSAFKKWNNLRDRHQNNPLKPTHRTKLNLRTKCQMSSNFKCLRDEWSELISILKEEGPLKKMDAINRHFNQFDYITDMANWQKKDYWATLSQFFNRDGDCEDYAIAKYYSLIELGFKPEQMRIVIVEDTNLNIAHAILAVYLNDEIWVLDNQISKITTESSIIHYDPLYSINESAWWLHKKL